LIAENLRVLDDRRLVEVQILGGRAAVEPDGDAVAPVRRDARPGDVAAAARHRHVNSVAPVEGYAAARDVDVRDAAKDVDPGDVAVVRHRGVVDVQSRSQPLRGYTSTVIVRYGAARHVQVVTLFWKSHGDYSTLLLLSLSQRQTKL
jgi:hypothetical protein